jgi:hypothetical protein
MKLIANFAFSRLLHVFFMCSSYVLHLDTLGIFLGEVMHQKVGALLLEGNCNLRQ